MNSDEENKLSIQQEQEATTKSPSPQKLNMSIEEKYTNMKTQVCTEAELWETNVKDAKWGLKLIFNHQFVAAEEIFQAHYRTTDGAIMSNPTHFRRDIRSAYALGHAVVSFIIGVSTFQKDQLDEALARVWTAQELSNVDEFVGNRLMRILTWLVAGVIRVMKHNWIKCAYNFANASRGIIGVQEIALNWQGVERDEIVSTIQIILGIFNLVISILPPTLVRVAQLVGFEGNRENAINYLIATWKSETVFAPLAAMVLLGYALELKQFLDIPSTDEDKFLCKEILEWSEKDFGESIMFNLMRSNLMFMNGDPSKACDILTSIEVHCKDLPALQLPIYWKNSLYQLVQMKFVEAKEYFGRCHQANTFGGRRSGGPRLVYLEGLCAGAKKDMFHMDKAFSTLEQYSLMPKTDWRPLDLLAMRKLKDYKKDKLEPLLELFEIMLVTVGFSKCTMKALDSAKGLLSMLFKEKNHAWSADHLVRCYAFFGALSFEQSLKTEQGLPDLTWLHKAQTNLEYALTRMKNVANKKNGVESYTNFLMAKVFLHAKKFDLALKHLNVARTSLSGVDYGVLFKFRLYSLEKIIENARARHVAE